MQFNIHFLISLVAALRLAAVVSATGINCNGSSNCGLARTSFMEDLNNVVSGDQFPTDRFYNNGEQIICGSQGICVFAQESGGLPASSVPLLIQDLQGHGCKVCGSIPLFFPDGDNNEDDFGFLTVNFVSHACAGKAVVSEINMAAFTICN